MIDNVRSEYEDTCLLDGEERSWLSLRRVKVPGGGEVGVPFSSEDIRPLQLRYATLLFAQAIMNSIASSAQRSVCEMT